MARSIVGNRATSGSDQRPMHDQLLRITTDRTINRRVRRSIVRSIVAACVREIVTATDRWYDKSSHAATNRTSNRGIM